LLGLGDPGRTSLAFQVPNNCHPRRFPLSAQALALPLLPVLASQLASQLA
jgi:hypothetical protein